MKKICLIIFICSLAIGKVNAQYLQSVLTLKNGEVLKGWVDNPKPDDRMVKFKSLENSTPMKYEKEEVYSIVLQSKNGPLKLQNVYVGGYHNSNLLLTVLVEGGVNLYGIREVGGPAGPIDYYFVKRDAEEKATLLNSLGVKKRLKEYFKDDSAIVKYISETPMIQMDLVGMVKRYNAAKAQKTTVTKDQ